MTNENSLGSLHVELRPLTSSDLDAFMAWGGDPEVTKTLFWDAHPTRESAREFLTSVVDHHGWFMAIIFEGRPVGAITLEKGKGKSARRAELGYVLARAYWGRGIVTQAVKLALARGFKDLDIDRIEAYVDPLNVASVGVLQKSGMSKEGLLRSYVVHRGVVRDRLLFSALKP